MLFDEARMVRRRVMKITLCVVAIGVLVCGSALGGIMWQIHQRVRLNCQNAQRAHPRPGDDVAALIDFMNSDSHALWDRTHRGVWTLGRLRDPRALPALEAVQTGEPCDHENNLCQYELGKAIELCGGTPIPPRKAKH